MADLAAVDEAAAENGEEGRDDGDEVEKLALAHAGVLSLGIASTRD
jgi:hypothetical protein